VLTTEAARLAARQKDSAGVAGDLLSVPRIKIRGSGPRGWLPYAEQQTMLLPNSVSGGFCDQHINIAKE